MDGIIQERSKILQTKKTVDWLINHTMVDEFNPLSFVGYQRSVDEKHCDRIVSYLNKEFFLPMSIICASRGPYSENGSLYIVDGQHRVQAFRVLKEKYPIRYEQIRNYELSVIVLEEAPIEVEINTFITINKTSKKVDTSLAYVLKNKINYANHESKDLSISKREYLSVELATRLNGSTNCKPSFLWENRILFEGAPSKQTPQLISLNAFVKSMRAFLGAVERYEIVCLDWRSREDLDICLNMLSDIIEMVWDGVRRKWPDLFDFDVEKRRIIQGSIGFSSINRFLSQKLKDENRKMSIDEFTECVAMWIREIQVSSRAWLPGGIFSRYSSEAGYSIIAQELMDGTSRYM